MQTILKISEAAAIALHAADYMAGRKELCSAHEIATALGVSYNHLSKVLQTMTKAGLVAPVRGPKGGFTLSPSGRKATVRDLMTAIDGPVRLHACLMGAKVCRHRDCMFGKFLEETNQRFDKVLDGKISEFSKRK
jgi:Rrf2 family protein